MAVCFVFPGKTIMRIHLRRAVARLLPLLPLLLLAPLASPLASSLPFATFANVELSLDDAPRAERVPDATGPPLRILYCSYLT